MHGADVDCRALDIRAGENADDALRMAAMVAIGVALDGEPDDLPVRKRAR
jgi:hypothetical protein